MRYEQGEEREKKRRKKSIAVSCSNLYGAKSVTGHIVFGWQTCPSVHWLYAYYMTFIPLIIIIKRCFTYVHKNIKTVRDRGAQGGHLSFHTAPEVLCIPLVLYWGNKKKTGIASRHPGIAETALGNKVFIRVSVVCVLGTHRVYIPNKEERDVILAFKRVRFSTALVRFWTQETRNIYA